MKRKIEQVPVDSGIIVICDSFFFKEYNSFNRINGNVIPIDNGVYQVNWEIKNTWNGNIKGDGVLSVHGEELCIVDPCYIIEDDEEWSIFLRDFNNIENTSTCIKIDSMGGDGEYDISLNIRKI